MREIIAKYKELITYVIFGGLTTVVSLGTFKLSNIVLGEEKYLISNIISWVLAVAFAYVTNKIWVFSSKSWKANVVLREASEFFAARLFSLGCEELGLFVCVRLFELGEISLEIFGFNVNGVDISKLVMQVVVVILNYVFSKFLVFKKKRSVEKAEDDINDSI